MKWCVGLDTQSIASVPLTSPQSDGTQRLFSVASADIRVISSCSSCFATDSSRMPHRCKSSCLPPLSLSLARSLCVHPPRYFCCSPALSLDTIDAARRCFPPLSTCTNHCMLTRVSVDKQVTTTLLSSRCPPTRPPFSLTTPSTIALQLRRSVDTK